MSVCLSFLGAAVCLLVFLGTHVFMLVLYYSFIYPMGVFLVLFYPYVCISGSLQSVCESYLKIFSDFDFIALPVVDVIKLFLEEI